MVNFKYTAKDLQGRDVAATMTAESEGEVIGKLRKSGLIPVKIVRDEKAGRKRFQKKVKAEAVVIFARQLATMIEAGLPLVQGLEALEQQQVQYPVFAAVIKTVKEDVEGGKSLSDALERHPRAFGALVVNLVRAGENSGTLAEIMDRIAKYLESARALQKKVKSAMMYPLVVSVMALIITIVLLVKVIPVFGTIFSSFGAELPLPTQMLLTFSDYLRRYILLALAGIVGIVFAFRAFYKTDKGRLRVDALVLRLPVFGDLIHKVVLSRFARTLSTLVRSGVPILRSLDIVAKTAGNYAVELAVGKAAQKIKEGESIAGPLEETKMFTPMVVRMISVGEKTGKVDTMLEKIADFFDDQVQTTLAGFTALIEPLLIAFLGIVVGTIVICMFLPILRLSSVVKI
ncbi:MAG: type II secretion system F family protein [Candidatus Aureabacteria bacterium]|jgi:type IV pilus assembly protein PilC|nr:type II secretion system F family protein [Candidatus Auribacterota bacterium]NLW93022.1 type II secretion system F family protein [Chlamydiota bacterium]HOE27255.1 type II secretion system F family protein [bacterium]